MKRDSARTLIGIAMLSLVASSPWVREGAGQDVGEIKLGAFLPVSGISADVGTQIKAGIEVAVERANQQGVRLGGRPYRVRVIWYDDEGKADVGLNVVTRALTLDKIHIGVGFLSSDVFLRVMDEFQKASIPVVDCCAASVKIPERIAQHRLGYVFQLSPTSREMAHALAATVATSAKPQKLALLMENTDGGRDLSRFTREWFAANAKGVDLVVDEFVDRGATDLTAQLTKIKRSGAQVIISEVYGSSAPILFNQWAELRVPAQIAHTGATVSAQDFIDKHRTVVEGSFVLNRWWPSRYSDLSEPMMAAYTKKTGVDPTNFAVQGHDSAVVAIEAAVKAGSLNPDQMRASLEQDSFVTAWGTRKFTPLTDGHRMSTDMVVIQVQGGKKVPLYPPAVAVREGAKYVPVPPFAWEKK